MKDVSSKKIYTCPVCKSRVLLTFVKTLKSSKKKFKSKPKVISSHPYYNQWDAGPTVERLILPHTRTSYYTMNLYTIPEHKTGWIFHKPCTGSGHEVKLIFTKTKGHGRVKFLRQYW